MDKEKNFASAVIYVHNAENRIECFLKDIIGIFEEHFEHAEVICVNDCSEDSSLEGIRKAGGNASRVSVSVLNMSYFHGLERAMNVGAGLAIGDFVFEFDHTQMDYPAETVMEVYRKSLEGYDIVSAVPDQRERLTSTCFYKMLGAFSELAYEMRTERFRVLSRRAINRVSAMNKTVPYRKVIYAESGLKTGRILYGPLLQERQRDRQEDQYRFRLAVDALILFTGMGYRFSIAMTCIMISKVAKYILKTLMDSYPQFLQIKTITCGNLRGPSAMPQFYGYINTFNGIKPLKLEV